MFLSLILAKRDIIIRESKLITCNDELLIRIQKDLCSKRMNQHEAKIMETI